MPGALPRNRFWILLGTLALLLIAAPIIRETTPDRMNRSVEIVTGVLFLAMLLSTVFAVAGRRAEVILSIALVVPYIVLWVVNLFTSSVVLWILSDAFAMTFVGWAIVVILMHLFRSEQVTGNMIAASMCVYMLMAVLWAEAYSIIWMLDPSAFSDALMPVASAEFGPPGHPSVLYFSLVTMTTLGYGDVVPKVGYARTMAAMQAVTGQLYIAVLVARLVGLHIAHSRRV
jgi:hypothetical protein